MLAAESIGASASVKISTISVIASYAEERSFRREPFYEGIDEQTSICADCIGRIYPCFDYHSSTFYHQASSNVSGAHIHATTPSLINYPN